MVDFPIAFIEFVNDVLCFFCSPIFVNDHVSDRWRNFTFRIKSIDSFLFFFLKIGGFVVVIKFDQGVVIRCFKCINAQVLVNVGISAVSQFCGFFPFFINAFFLFRRSKWC